MSKLTLSMIVKNEEINIYECLQSVQEVVDEIIIVDTGSTDKTIEIAEQNGAKVYSFDWVNDFSAARNFALEKSTGDWILYLDADERLNKNSFEEIKKIKNEVPDKAYYCKILNKGSDGNNPSVMSYVRLFPKIDAIRFKGKVHEQIAHSLIKNDIELNDSKISIEHIGYDLSEEEIKSKAERNLKILLEEFKGTKEGYTAFHLGQTYHKLGNREKSIKYFTLAASDGNLGSEYKSLIYRYLAVYYSDRMELERAANYIEKSLKYDYYQPLSHLTASRIYSKSGKKEVAPKFCTEALLINKEFIKGKRTSLQTIYTSEEVIIYNGLNVALEIGNEKLFHEFYKKLKSRNHNDKLLHFFDSVLSNKSIDISDFSIADINEDNLEFLLKILQNYKQLNERNTILEILSEKYSSNTLLFNNYGLSLMESGNSNYAVELFEKSRKINSHDPATLFYLISAHIQSGSLEAIIPLVNEAENSFKDRKDVMYRVGLLKQKLAQFA